jgi:hypothetical protein
MSIASQRCPFKSLLGCIGANIQKSDNIASFIIVAFSGKG